MEKYSADKKFIVMTGDQVRAFDAWAVNQLGIDGTVLMENAGRSCAEFIFEKFSGSAKPGVCIICGTGNNGGDGFVIARHLFNRRFEVKVIICGDRAKIKGDAKKNLDIWQGISGDAVIIDPSHETAAEELARICGGADLLVDALFGTGLKGPLRPEYVNLIQTINSCKKQILAVDIPSGLDCDSGESLGAVIKADWTVTFAAIKKGFINKIAAELAGEIFIASIGVDPGSERY